MKEKIKRIGALAVFGIMVLIMCAPVPSAQILGTGLLTGNSYYCVIDRDNDANDEVWTVWHDGSPHDTPPGEELFRIQEDGKVGIGTQGPTQKLDVNGSVRVRVLPQDDTLNDIVVADANGVLHIRDVTTIGGAPVMNWYDVNTDSPSTDINADIYTKGKVGIGTVKPITTLDVNGGFATNIITVKNHYKATSSDYTILVDASQKNVRIKLPLAAEAEGQILNLKRIDDDKKTTVIIDADGSETIDGASTIKLNCKYMSYTIQCDGSDWYILGSYGFMGRSHLNNKNR